MFHRPRVLADVQAVFGFVGWHPWHVNGLLGEYVPDGLEKGEVLYLLALREVSADGYLLRNIACNFKKILRSCKIYIGDA